MSKTGDEEERCHDSHHRHHGKRHHKHHKKKDSQYVIKYIHGPGIDEPLAIKQKGRVYYYHADGLGSVTALTDERGKVVQRYKYDSFGNMKHRGHKVKQAYTFTGREWDKETGLYYYRARYYDPEVGRFISFDPILHPADGLHKNRTCGQNSNSSLTSPSFISLLHDTQTLNPYVYVENLPTTKTDPSGLGPSTECVIYSVDCTKGVPYACVAFGPCLRGFPWQEPNSPQNRCIRNCILDFYEKGCTDFVCQTIVHAYCFTKCEDKCPK